MLFALLVSAPIEFVLDRSIGLGLRPGLETAGFMVSAVAFAPFVEELAFRAGLRSPNWAWLSMPVVGASLLAGSRLTLALAVLMGIVWLIDYAYRRSLPEEARMRSRWRRSRLFIRHYPLLVRSYAILFAAAHFSIFVLDAGSGWKNIFLVLAVTSQFMSGLVFSYLRLRYGLLSCMTAHCAWNACVVGLV